MADVPHITVLYDGLCPYCVAQAKTMRRLDAGRGAIVCVDFTSSTFDSNNYGLTKSEATSQMHGVLPDGQILRGMDVIRRAYAAAGWGWLAAPTGWPGLRWIFDRWYAWFARNRRRLTWSKRACDEGRCGS